MSNPAPLVEPPSPPIPPWLVRALGKPWSYVLMAAAILALDVLTGPFLMFPILFVVPVTLAAWFYSGR